MTSELDRLERRAQEVRGQLALDLDELFVRLQPRRMVRSVAVYARDRQVGSTAGRELVRDMRHNPIPYLLVGLGVAGLAWAMTSFSRSRTATRLPRFSDADFAPSPSPRATATPPAAPVTPAVVKTATSAPSPATNPVTPVGATPAREISPATTTDR